MLSFPPFRLDLDNERLWKNDEELRLRRKPFAILRHLAQRPQRLVLHEELVEAIWGRVAMSESLLRTHVSAIRRVLGEGVIETVAGRGYRFLPTAKYLDFETSRGAASTLTRVTAGFVGRECELDVLHSAFRAVSAGKRTTIFISGEAGAGKTTLVEVLLARASVAEPAFTGWGACVEQYGSGQAYLPVIDAIRGLCRGAGADRVVDVFTRHAPAWLLQIPGVVPQHRFDELRRCAAVATPASTMCELADALETLTANGPVVVVFDDLQWIDPSTAELIAFLGSRRAPAKLLLIGTYRPEEVPRGHPLTRLTAELIAHRRASSLVLDGLGCDAVDAYVSKRCPGHAFPRELTRTLERSTGGNPLFLSALVDDLEARRLIRQQEGGWELATSVQDVAARCPDGIRRLIDVRIGRLCAVEQRVVEVAGMTGMTFAASAIARKLGADARDVDSVCEALVNERRVLRYVSTESAPDGTIQSCYAFRHALFRHAVVVRSVAATLNTQHAEIPRVTSDVAAQPNGMATPHVRSIKTLRIG